MLRLMEDIEAIISSSSTIALLQKQNQMAEAPEYA